ncbi:MAG: PD40 domain-containing protein [Pyrinomonadaceae bacterium]|nr:PD40 domain-containing protein [Pyrinomonadaceae bacterium]
MKIDRRLSAPVLALCLSIFYVSLAQQPVSRGITPEDYYSFEFVGDPQISPDGKLIAYIVTKVDREQNRRTTSIWMAATDGSRPPWQFTTSPQASSSPRWSPNGRWLAFLSSRPGDPAVPTSAASPAASPMTAATAPASGPTPAPTPSPAAGAALSDPPRAQVYALSMSGGEAQRITNLKNGVSTFRWSPDGNRIIVVSRIGPSDGRPESRERSDVRHYKTPPTSLTTPGGSTTVARTCGLSM